MEPVVSVIVPNYNHAAFLQERIDSVLGQTFQFFELIILDDFSADQSREVIERYRGHPKISHIVYNDSNGGSPFKQWEKGIGLARGEYIWIAESDDWCEPTLLDNLVIGLRHGENCVLGYVQSTLVGRTGEVLKRTSHRKLSEYFAGPDFIATCLFPYCLLCNASMALFKRSAFYGVSNRYSSFKMCGDWIFWTEIARQGNVFVSGKSLNYFRKHDGDVSTAMYATGQSFVEEIRALSLLRSAGLIDYDLLKKSLAPRYVQYLGLKKRFPAGVQQEIEATFFAGIRSGDARRISMSARIALLKAKTARRLGL
ncbi:glycosyltransferase family 2 protein [Hufsiella ginkgonis]|uniref:Glycosyltransferase n=1 Tax=Hufsiella ginkgonis TaxID=2695274 RepID=A0A7K1Y357_9SPHI|nr:glycosyltransferase family 2 protein [Hufsiella ginkgonis]MXV17459.1 glycosyltransferase [Hufsiella ginkgonis]